MPTIDPKGQFWIGIVVTIAIAVTGGTLSFSHLIPADWIPTATQLCEWIAFIGSTVLTGLNGMAMTKASRLAGVEGLPVADRLAHAADIPGVEEIVTTPELANATPNNKVVSK